MALPVMVLPVSAALPVVRMVRGRALGEARRKTLIKTKGKRPDLW
jgi:hypothetical protein